MGKSGRRMALRGESLQREAIILQLESIRRTYQFEPCNPQKEKARRMFATRLMNYLKWLASGLRFCVQVSTQCDAAGCSGAAETAPADVASTAAAPVVIGPEAADSTAQRSGATCFEVAADSTAQRSGATCFEVAADSTARRSAAMCSAADAGSTVYRRHSKVASSALETP